MIKSFYLGLILPFVSLCSFAQTQIEAKDAAKHKNEDVRFTDKVYGGKFFMSSGITLLDVGGMHPNEAVTLLIKAADRKKFESAPEDLYKGKKVTVTGTVIDYKGKPEIIINDPAQIKLEQ